MTVFSTHISGLESDINRLRVLPELVDYSENPPYSAPEACNEGTVTLVGETALSSQKTFLIAEQEKRLATLKKMQRSEMITAEEKKHLQKIHIFAIDALITNWTEGDSCGSSSSPLLPAAPEERASKRCCLAQLFARTRVPHPPSNQP